MRLYKRGSTYWTEFIVDNKRYQYSCKTKDKTVAAEVASAIHADIIRNRFDIPAKNKADRIFGEIWQEYRQGANNVPKVLINKDIAYKHFKGFFADKPINDITIVDIKNYQLQRKLETMQKNAGKRESEINFDWVNKEINILSNFFNYCIEHTYIEKNPASRIKKLNTLSRIKTLSDSDIQKCMQRFSSNTRSGNNRTLVSVSTYHTYHLNLVFFRY